MQNEYKIIGDTVEIYYTRRIDGLSFTALIDLADFPLVDSIPGNWFVGFFGHRKVPYMATLKIKRRQGKSVESLNMLLHRFIMGSPKKKVIDHIGGNETTLDNRRSNLRAIDHGENTRKRFISSERSWNSEWSPAKFIVKSRRGKYFQVNVMDTYHGIFHTLAEAIVQRDMAVTWHNWNNTGRLVGEPEPVKPALRPQTKVGRKPGSKNLPKTQPLKAA